MKWTPKKDTIGVPDEGFIMAKDFTIDHLKKMIKRAINRKIPVDVFLSYSLRPANSEDIYIVDDSEVKEESEVEQLIEEESALKDAETVKTSRRKVKENED